CFDMDDSEPLLRLALKELGLSIDPDFFKTIKRSDIVEVYDDNHIQVFRSFNFFRMCNYNLDDILAHEWFELYQRDESITNEIMTNISAHMSGATTITTCRIPEHILRERFSGERAVFFIRFRHFASVFSGPESRPGFVCTLQARQVQTDSNQIGFLSSR